MLKLLYSPTGGAERTERGTYIGTKGPKQMKITEQGPEQMEIVSIPFSPIVYSNSIPRSFHLDGFPLR